MTVSRPVGGILFGSGPDVRQEAGVAIHPSGLPSLLSDRTSSPSPTLGLAPGGFSEPESGLSMRPRFGPVVSGAGSSVSETERFHRHTLKSH